MAGFSEIGKSDCWLACLPILKLDIKMSKFWTLSDLEFCFLNSACVWCFFKWLDWCVQVQNHDSHHKNTISIFWQDFLQDDLKITIPNK